MEWCHLLPGCRKDVAAIRRQSSHWLPDCSIISGAGTPGAPGLMKKERNCFPESTMTPSRLTVWHGLKAQTDARIRVSVTRHFHTQCRPMSTEDKALKPYYITTPIFYPNSGPCAYGSQYENTTDIFVVAHSTSHRPSSLLSDSRHISPIPPSYPPAPTCPLPNRHRRTWSKDPEGGA